jgi:hypothetical protein
LVAKSFAICSCKQAMGSISSFTASVAILFGSIEPDKLLLSSSFEKSLRLVGTDFVLEFDFLPLPLREVL